MLLRTPEAYSIMLHMKTRVTFRVAADLATALRELPNQTDFVERALRDALGWTCPLCAGSGRVPARGVRVSNLRQLALAPLDRGSALQLRRLVQLARNLAATDVDLFARGPAAALGFVVKRADDVLLRGTMSSVSTSLESN
jgi:hypothetical protein